MNYLAHIHLARHSDDAMLGALLGDFVGSADMYRYNAVMQGEIRLHRSIDSFTDRHPAVIAARSLFPEGRRRFAGILLDVHFDHLLARVWPDHNPVDLDQFNRHFYAVLLQHLPHLPERLQQIAPHMAAHDWLGAYRDRDNVDFAVQRIATRLSRNGDKLIACLPILRQHETQVAQHFDDFFPELLAYVAQQRATAE